MTIPTLENVSPKLAELKERHHLLCTTRMPLVEECKALRYRLDLNNPHKDAVVEDNNVLKRAFAIAGIASTETPKQSDTDRLAELLVQIQDLNNAIGLLAEEIRRESAKASVGVCVAVKSEHDRLARAFAKQFIELHNAHRTYREFIHSVEAVGVTTTSLKPIFPSFIGDYRDSHGSYAHILKEFREAGHIKSNEIPEVIRL